MGSCRLWYCRVGVWKKDSQGGRGLGYSYWTSMHVRIEVICQVGARIYCVAPLWTWHLTWFTRRMWESNTGKVSKELKMQWVHSQKAFPHVQRSCEPDYTDCVWFLRVSTVLHFGSGAELFNMRRDKFRSHNWGGRNDWFTQQRVRLTWNYTWAPTGMRQGRRTWLERRSHSSDVLWWDYLV